MISAPNLDKASEERKRSLLLVLAIIFLISAPVYVGYFFPQIKDRPTQIWDHTLFSQLTYYLVTVQTVLFIFLTISTHNLFTKLNQLESTCTYISFKKEKRDVFFTMILFDIMYLLRILLGFTLIPWMYSGQAFGGSKFKSLETSIVTCSLLDLTPIVFVMLLHRSNFKRQATIRCSSYAGFLSENNNFSEQLLENDKSIAEEESLVTECDRKISDFDQKTRETKFGVQTLESYQAYIELA